MRCDQCPALVYGYQIDDEYYSACKLGYQQIEYKDNSDYTYCKKQRHTIEEKINIINKIEYLKRYGIEFSKISRFEYSKYQKDNFKNIKKEKQVKSLAIPLSQFELFSYGTLNKIIKLTNNIKIYSDIYYNFDFSYYF